MNDLLKVILLGVLEGVTEFLPVSSTGHLFLAGQFMGIDFKGGGPAAAFWDAFNIVIQIGAILAVVLYFRRRILDLLLGTKRPTNFAQVTPRHQIDQAAWALTGAVVGGAGAAAAGPGAEAMAEEQARRADAYLTTAQRWHAIRMCVLATLPLAAAPLAEKVSKHLEGRAVAIALALVVGGVVMLVIERVRRRVTAERLEQISPAQAIVVGCCQVLAAVFPGTSRSAATIMSGLACGLSRPAATEFSFFLAIPAMFAACAYKLLKWQKENSADGHQIMLMTVGTAVSFVVAWFVIAGFMSYIRRHTFVPFAVYRIVFGLAVIGVAWG